MANQCDTPFRCPHDGAKCVRGCTSECHRKLIGRIYPRPWPGFPVAGAAPVPWTNYPVLQAATLAEPSYDDLKAENERLRAELRAAKGRSS